MKRASIILMAILLMLSSASVLVTPAFAAEETSAKTTIIGETRSADAKNMIVVYDLYIDGTAIAYLQFSLSTENCKVLELKSAQAFDGYMGGNNHIFYAARDVGGEKLQFVSLTLEVDDASKQALVSLTNTSANTYAEESVEVVVELMQISIESDLPMPDETIGDTSDNETTEKDNNAVTSSLNSSFTVESDTVLTQPEQSEDQSISSIGSSHPNLPETDEGFESFFSVRTMVVVSSVLTALLIICIGVYVVICAKGRKGKS